MQSAPNCYRKLSVKLLLVKESKLSYVIFKPQEIISLAVQCCYHWNESPIYTKTNVIIGIMKASRKFRN